MNGNDHDREQGSAFIIGTKPKAWCSRILRGWLKTLLNTTVQAGNEIPVTITLKRNLFQAFLTAVSKLFYPHVHNGNHSRNAIAR